MYGLSMIAWIVRKGGSILFLSLVTLQH